MRVLAPIDFSEQSLLALREADQIAKRLGAELTLLHVHPFVDAAVMDFVYVEAPTTIARITTEAENRLQGIARELTTPLSSITVTVLTGAPVSEILRLAEQHDLVVIGTHGRSGLSHFLLGSVAERVVRGARCSVLTVKRTWLAENKAPTAFA